LIWATCRVIAFQRRIVALGTQLCLPEPRRREFLAAIRHVFAAEDAEPEHLRRRQLRPEVRMEFLPTGAAGRHV
jgi:hypothetical protein